jgi:hypothetical protein
MSNRIADLFDNGFMNKAIFINPLQSQFEKPKANLDTKEVEFHEPYLSYLWCISYTMIDLLEIIDIQLRSGKEKVNFKDNPDADELSKLLNWAFSLKEEYSCWPQNMISPEIQTPKVIQANKLFAETLRYIFFHEVAHLANHSDYIEIIKKIKQIGYEPTDTELDLLKQLEQEADNYSFDCLILNNDSEAAKYSIVLSAITAHLSDFFSLNNSDTRGYRHQDIDVRLFNLIGRFELNQECHDIYIKQMVSVGIQLFMHFKNINYELEENNFQTFEELISELFGIIDKEKEKYSSEKK